MTIETPLWMQGAAGVPGYPARLDRMLFAQLWDEGVMDLTAFKVSQRAAGADFSVEVSIGEAVVTGDHQTNQGNYMARCTAIEPAVVTAKPGANSRYDIVCLAINDPNAGGPGGSTATIVVTAGVVAAVPAVPVAPLSSLLLAVIGPISAATGSITNAIITDARQLAGRRCQPGTFEETANSVAPNGWLFAAGQAVSRAVYAKLFAHIGTTFGVGDGATTFNVPDRRGRVGVGVDNMGGIDAGRLAAANALGGVGGEESHLLIATEMPTHTHAATVGNNSVWHTHAGVTANQSALHTHTMPVTQLGGRYDATVNNGAGFVANWVTGAGTATSTESANHNHPFATGNDSVAHNHAVANANAGGGVTHNNMQPYVLVNVLIRT